MTNNHITLLNYNFLVYNLFIILIELEEGIVGMLFLVKRDDYRKSPVMPSDKYFLCYLLIIMKYF